MQMREFGKTGVQVSALAFGCGRVGGLLVNGSQIDQERAFDAALAGGINWFDTAEAYGSEEALGKLLAWRKAEMNVSTDVNVSTKVTLDPQSSDLAGDVVRQSEACMRRLQRDRLTVLQVHNRIDDTATGNGLTIAQMTGPVLEGLSRMRAMGKTKLIGLTALGDTASILQVIDTGAFQSAQIYYNPINPSAARAMPPAWSGQNFAQVMTIAQKHGMGMLGIRILDGGIIATDQRDNPVSMMARETSEDIEQNKTTRMLEALQKKCPDAISNRAQFGVRFALGCQYLSAGIVGIGEPFHVDEALAAESMGPLPADAYGVLENMYESNFG